MAERVTVPSAFLRSLPPWLQRRVGAAVAGGIADVLEAVVQDTAAGVRARFPTADVDPGALAQIGAERRIRRGPSEAAATYAARLQTWWDAHRHRGSPYELLRQLWGFFHSSLPMRMDVVSQLGNRHYLLDTATSGEADQVVHDVISWGGNGQLDGTPVLLAGNALPGALELRPVDISSFPADRSFPIRLSDGAGGSETVTATGTTSTPYDRIVLSTPVVGTYMAGLSTATQVSRKWAHLWVFFYVTRLVDVLVDAADEVLVTDAGDTLVATSVFSGAITDADAEMFRAIPREWSAAHIPYVTVVLLYDVARLWGYPVPVPEWGDGFWQSSDPVILIADT